jgi:nucleotide-binding universal stress UspA family protein
MVRDVLVHVEDTDASVRVVEFAAKLAHKHSARLTGIALNPPAMRYFGDIGVGAPVVADLEAMAGRARQRFELAIADASTEAVWRTTAGTTVRELALHARFADVTVIGQNDPESLFRGLAIELVMAAGRPALLVPPGWAGDAAARHVLVAWNSTRESARALHDALPMLRAAESVTVVTVAENGVVDVAAAAGLDISAHLVAHGVSAELVHAPLCDDAGLELLARASDKGCDLLVMGVYGRSRLSELIYGGASRSVLDHMRLPVLMSH